MGFVIGIMLLWFTTAQLPEKHHLALLGHPSTLLAKTWRFIAPSSAVSQYRTLAKRKDLERWIEEEKEIAWNRISSNIGPAAGASDGIVIASPSSGQHLTEPDYYVRLSSFWADWVVYMDKRCRFDYLCYATDFPP
jgi:hypothetical protein